MSEVHDALWDCFGREFFFHIPHPPKQPHDGNYNLVITLRL